MPDHTPHMLRRLRTSLAALLILLPAAAGAQWNDSLLKPFTIDHRAAAPGSPADVSFLLEAPAGKHGFVRVRDGHLVKGNGERLRLWGVHLTDWSRGSVLLPSKEDIPLWAGTLARHGVNAVRLHFIDLNDPRGGLPRGIIDTSRADSRRFDAGQLDRLDFLVAELKKRGIWIDLNLNVGRSYRAGDGVRDHDRIRWAKGMVLYDPRLIELQKEYARMLLSHVNPYTKLAYRDEPAIAIVEILNENGLWVGFNAPTPYYNDLLTRQYNDWLTKTLSPAQVARLRELSGAPADSLIPRLRSAEVGDAPKERFDAEMAFIAHVESTFYLDMARYLRDSLGVRVPITGTNDHSHTGSSYPMLMSLATLDIMDGHTYWQHPGSPPPVNTPMVNDPLHSSVVKLSRTAVAGKPFTVSETNHPFPNDWLAEGLPILSAYAGFQDWDGIFIYTFEPKRDAAWQPYIGDPFDISLDPVRMTQVAAGALTFLRGDVKPARQTVTRSYTRDQVFESRRIRGDAWATTWPYFTPGFPLSTPLRHASRIASFDGPATGPFAGGDSLPFVSDTRELAWLGADRKQGLVTVDAERTQALIGFIKANAAAATPPRHLAAEIDNDFASVVLVSLDASPVARASRLLLSTASRVTNTGFQWNAQRTAPAQQGTTPTLIEPVTGRLILRGLTGAKAVSATALDGSGKPTGQPIHATMRGANWVLPIGTPVTTWYVVTVRR